MGSDGCTTAMRRIGEDCCARADGISVVTSKPQRTSRLFIRSPPPQLEETGRRTADPIARDIAAESGCCVATTGRGPGLHWVINQHTRCLAGTANVTPLPDVGTGGARR